MHNLELTEDQTLIVETVRSYVADQVAAGTLEADEHRHFVRAEFSGLAELGVFGMSVPEATGGAGMGLLPLVAAAEEIGGTNGSLGRLLLGQVQSAAALAQAGGGPLGEVLEGSKLAVFVGPEHGVKLEGVALQGAAELVPGGGEAALFVVAAVEGTEKVLCMVDAAATRREALRSLGFASTAPARVHFGGVAATVVARGAAASAAVDAAQTAGWLAGAGLAVGMAHASLQAGRKHAAERIAFGKPLLAQRAVLRKLVECKRATDAAKQLAWHAARLADAGLESLAAVATARIAAVDAAVAAADEAIQILGGYGYTVEYHVERHYRDAKTLEVLDGGNEALKNLLAQLQFA